MLHKELSVIESNENYIKALDTIKNLQKPIIEKFDCPFSVMTLS